MSIKFACGRLSTSSHPHHGTPQRLLLIVVMIIISNIGQAWAGECLTSNKELYDGIVAFYAAAKKGEMDSGEYGRWGLRCWRKNQGLNARLRTVLTDMLFDSRIHPAHVAAALCDYRVVFGVPKLLLGEVEKKQGPSRFAIILAILENKGAAFSATAGKVEESLPGEMDFIDGPANLQKSPQGPIVTSLPDNMKVRILRKQGNWVEIVSGGSRGWTLHTNLMGSHVSEVDADGFYVLSRASFMGYFETVDFLLAHGAKAALVDGFGRNALHWAVRGGFAGLATPELDMVKRLSAVPDINVNLVDKHGETPLLTAIGRGRLDMATVLIGMETIDLNVPDHNGMTPLMHAIRCHRSDIAEALLNARNLHVDAVDAQGRTALYHAVAQGDHTTARFLLDRKARTNTITKDDKTLLHALLESQSRRPVDVAFFKLLTAQKDIDINKADMNGNTVMFLAINQCRLDIVKLFLERPDLDVNKPLRDGKRYLNQAMRLGHRQHSHGIALMLLDREDIDVNVPMDRGDTVVHMSWYDPQMGTRGLDLARKILSRSPELNRENDYDETPLVYNIRWNRPEMVRLLVGAKGMDLDRLVSQTSRTPLQLAIELNRAEIIEILKKAGARNYPLVGNEERTPEGIPQALLQNDEIKKSILIHRGYFVWQTDQTLVHLRQKRMDEAMAVQEAILDGIIDQYKDVIKKFPADQRKCIIDTFTVIRDHYRRYPRAGINGLTEQQKTAIANLDARCDELIGKSHDAMPDKRLVNNPHLAAILLFEDYKAKNSIKVLGMLQGGKVADAEKYLQDLRDLSDPKGYYKK